MRLDSAGFRVKAAAVDFPIRVKPKQCESRPKLTAIGAPHVNVDLFADFREGSRYALASAHAGHVVKLRVARRGNLWPVRSLFDLLSSSLALAVQQCTRLALARAS